jgi:hypothetical protein
MITPSYERELMRWLGVHAYLSQLSAFLTSLSGCNSCIKYVTYDSICLHNGASSRKQVSTHIHIRQINQPHQVQLSLL